ncbi:hypothetical protein EIP86_002323 [Pleurotus ostreatoroseus]|nr:hypothetical protein EIP86_002323 [Pleurotus ostreatoroseus]
MPKAVESLNDSIMGGFTISATPSPPPLTHRRTRGVDGRQEAAARGALTGDGPSAGITGNGRNVVITGLPGKMTSEGVKLWLKNFKLAGNTAEEKEINKIQPCSGDFTKRSTNQKSTA